MSPRAVSRLLAAAALLALVLLGGYLALAIPAGAGPDEDAHLARAIRLHSPGGSDAAATPLAAPRPPSLYHLVGAAALRFAAPGRLDPASPRLEAVRRLSFLPGPYRTDIEYVRRADRDELVPSPIYPLRAVSLLFGVVLLAGLCLGARWALGVHRRAVAASVGWALLPGVVLSAAVASDAIAVAALGTLAYALYVRTLAGRFLTEPWHAVLLGLVLGAAVMTRPSGLVPALLLPVAVGLAAVGPWRPAVVWNGAVALITLAAVAVAGWWCFADLAPRDGLVPRFLLTTAGPERPLGFAMDQGALGHGAARLVRGYLGELGGGELALSRPLLLVFLALGGVAAGGVLLLVRDRWRAWCRGRRPPARLASPEHFVLSDDPRVMAASRGGEVPPAAGADEEEEAAAALSWFDGRTLLFALAAVAVTFAALLVWSLLGQQPSGRDLHAVLLPATLLGVAGVRRVVGVSAFRIAAPVLAALPLLATVYVVRFEVLPHYHPAKAKFRRGEVLRYDDAGHPRTAPHLVREAGRSGDYEPWGTYSTARVPEMNVAWGAPELRFRYRDLDLRQPCQVRVTYYGGHEAGKFGLVPYQELWAGAHRLHGPVPLTFRPRELAYSLPSGAIADDGQLELCFRCRAGAAAAVAEVWIERAWIALTSVDVTPAAPGPGERVQVRLTLRNRDPAAAHRPELFLFTRSPEGALRALVGQETVDAVAPGGAWQGGLIAVLPAGVAGHELLVGVRRVDRGPWAIFKGATWLGAAGEKQGDLAARDLHVAVLAAGRTGVVVRAECADAAPGPYRCAIRYRATVEGALVVRGSAGEELERLALPPTGGRYVEREGRGRGAAGAARTLEVAFARAGEAAVDEIGFWADGDRSSFDLVPAGRVH
ncbi:MAG: hypothetical protein JXQ29_03800 [Planctomycetes bacterium]|nr:hypothetical protein [Planctomycetota bacterium]